MTTRSSMFSRKRSTPVTGDIVTSLVAPGTRVTGDIGFEGSLFLDGQVDGQITASAPGAQLTIGEQGQVQGNIRVPAAIIHGHVCGDVYAMERLELATTARVTGDLHYRSIAIVAGAQINGRMLHHAMDADDIAAPPMASTDTVAGASPNEPIGPASAAFATEQTIEGTSAGPEARAEESPTTLTTEPTGSPAEGEPQHASTPPEPLLIVQPRRRGRLHMTKSDA